MAENKEPDGPAVNRRGLLKGALALVGTAAANSLLGALSQIDASKPAQTPTLTPQPAKQLKQTPPSTAILAEAALAAIVTAPAPTTSKPNPVPVEVTPTPKVEIPAYIQQLNQIANLPLESPERITQEQKYAETAKNKEEIDTGLWIIQDSDLRANLLKKRYSLRETGTNGLKPLEEPLFKWCVAQGIHPETLTQVLDAYQIVCKLFSAEEVMNPGGMAALVTTETSKAVQFYIQKDQAIIASLGFGYIGETPIFETLKQLKKDPIANVDPQKEKESLVKLCQLLSQNHRVYFNPDQIVGSTAGAIGLQFMPSTALDIYNDLQKIGYSFNPFDITSSLIGAWYLLKKNGYQKGNPGKILKALKGWNAATEQINKIYQAAVAFFDQFHLKYPQFA